MQRVDAFAHFRLARPKHHIVACRAEQVRKRRAPRSRANDRNLHRFLLLYGNGGIFMPPLYT